MTNKFTNMLRRQLTVNWDKNSKPVDMKQHSLGIGGVHSMPAPKAIVKQTAMLKPRLVRIFLQEFFYVYESPGVYNWAKMDAYMDAVHAMGADIMASICLKPQALFPEINEKICLPNDTAQWQNLIRALVTRYSIDKPYVTHWAIANEVNIGEWGGCPYLIESPDDYFEYYKLTVAPIREVLPDIKIGGPSYAGGGEDCAKYLARFVELCKKENVQVDFVTYNVYTDNPAGNAADGRAIRDALDEINPGVELFITEFNTFVFDDLSLEESAYDPRRSACQAACILALYDENCVTGTFQYHIYDQWCDPREFAPWYSRTRYMAEHWNDSAHRLGLMDLDGKPRPQYYLYRMLYALEGTQVEMLGTDELLRGISCKGDDGWLSMFITNYDVHGGCDFVSQIRFENAPEGVYRLTVYRLDAETSARIKSSSEFDPVESRVVYVHPDFHFDIFTPADSVTLIQLESDGC